MVALPSGSTDAPKVRCPRCGTPCLYAASNKWRPFCSEHCRSIDLGAWASERYRVPAKPTVEADEDDAPPPAAH